MVVESIKKGFSKYLFKTTIVAQDKPAELQTFIEDYFMINDIKTKVGRDYRDLVDELRKEMCQ